jgi:hypothetical protein
VVVTISFYDLKHVIINIVATNILSCHWLDWIVISLDCNSCCVKTVNVSL